MKKVIFAIKETGEALTITKNDITGFFPNEQDGSYLNLKIKTIAGTQLGAMFEEWKDETFGAGANRICIDAGIGLLINEFGVKFRFFGYRVDYSKKSNLRGFSGQIKQYSKHFEAGVIGDLLGLVA